MLTSTGKAELVEKIKKNSEEFKTQQPVQKKARTLVIVASGLRAFNN